MNREITELKPGRVNLVLPGGFAINPPIGLDEKTSEKIRKWKWVKINDTFASAVNIAVLQGRVSAGFTTLPRDAFEAFGFLMDDGENTEVNAKKVRRYNYLIMNCRDNSVEAENCFIGCSELPSNEYGILVPLGWSKTVLKLVEANIVLVDKAYIRSDSPNLIAHHQDGSWQILKKDISRNGPKSWTLSQEVMPPK